MIMNVELPIDIYFQKPLIQNQMYVSIKVFL